MSAAAVVVLGAAFFGLQVGAIWALGAWTLVLYRSGGLHDAQARTTQLAGAAALVVDVVFAAVTTFCGCMTQPVVFAFQRAGQGVRAVRFLALASVLRVTLLGAVVLAWPSPWLGLALLGLVVAWAAGVAQVVSAQRHPIAPSAVFTRRASRAPVRFALRDSWRETGEMLRRYAPHLAVPAVVAAGLFTLDPEVPWHEVHPAALALLAGVLGAVVPLDLVALLPVLAALASLGAPAALLLPIAFGAEASSVRSRRVAEGYLLPAVRARYAASVRALPLLVALACVVLG